MFLQLLANGLVTGSVIALAAAGVSIVYGILRLVNFAYGDYMTFGAFIAVYFNVNQDLPIVPAALLAMGATALLSVALELVLWRPLRARSAGFMSLFLVSVGLALVLRHVIYLVAGPQPRTYAVNPYKVYVIGSARLSGAQGIAIVVAGVAQDPDSWMVHGHDRRNSLCRSQPQHRNFGGIRNRITIQRHHLKNMPRQSQAADLRRAGIEDME